MAIPPSIGHTTVLAVTWAEGAAAGAAAGVGAASVMHRP